MCKILEVFLLLYALNLFFGETIHRENGMCSVLF